MDRGCFFIGDRPSYSQYDQIPLEKVTMLNVLLIYPSRAPDLFPFNIVYFPRAQASSKYGILDRLILMIKFHFALYSLLCFSKCSSNFSNRCFTPYSFDLLLKYPSPYFFHHFQVASWFTNHFALYKFTNLNIFGVTNPCYAVKLWT